LFGVVPAIVLHCASLCSIVLLWKRLTKPFGLGKRIFCFIDGFWRFAVNGENDVLAVVAVCFWLKQLVSHRFAIDRD
jgi:hypothetical protein